MLWMGIWVHYYIFMPCRWRGNFVKLGVMVSPNDIIVSCFGAVTNPTLHLTSTLDVYEVFEHLHMLQIGTWVHPYIVMPCRWGPIFGKLVPLLSLSDMQCLVLRLYNTPLCIPHPYWMCKLSSFVCCRWAHEAPTHSYAMQLGGKFMKLGEGEPK